MKSRLLAALAACLLMSCGGGGGDDSGAVSFEVTGPARVDVEAYEGMLVPSTSIDGRVKGDVKGLNGKTLYLMAVVAGSGTAVFDSARPFINPDHISGGIFIGNRTLAPYGVGTFTGTITIRACLDEQCQTELPVSNATVPYTAHIKPGLTFNGAAPNFDVTFGGTAPAPITIPINLPEGATSWSVYDMGDTTNFYRTAIRADKAADGSAAVVVSVNYLVAPGETVSQGIRVVASTPDGLREHRNVFTATMTTRPSTQAYAFQWPRGEFSVRQGAAQTNHFLGLMFTDHGANRLEFRGVTYGPGNTLSYGWLWVRASAYSDSFYEVEMQAQPCYETGPSTEECLPPGHYEATVNYRYTPLGGSPIDIAYPVTMEALPR